MTTYPDDRPITSVTVRLDALGEMIAAVPAMLGFTPHRSLVLICLTSDHTQRFGVGTIMRHDVDIPVRHGTGYSSLIKVPDTMFEAILRFAAQCRQEGVVVALGLVVDDRGSIGDDRYEVLAQCLSDELADRGTTVLRVLSTAHIEAGSEWTTLVGPDERGLVPDPRESPVTLAYAVQGRSVLSSREELTDVLRPVDDDVSRRLALLMPTAREDRSGSDGLHLEEILRLVESAASTSPDLPPTVDLSIDSAARIGVALNRVMVRDSLLALVLTDVAQVAEMLWSYLMRVLPAPERAVAASLVAFAAYARGDGATAVVAIDVALEADPGYSLARLLERSLDAGAGPGLIREVALSGYSVAELCGVRLPLPSSR